jgi:hypothetical protein
VRESRQEMTAVWHRCATRLTSSGTGASACAAAGRGRSLRTLSTGIESGRVRMLGAPSSLRSGLMQVAATTDKVRVAPPQPRAGLPRLTARRTRGGPLLSRSADSSLSSWRDPGASRAERADGAEWSHHSLAAAPDRSRVFQGAGDAVARRFEGSWNRRLRW